MSDEQQVARRAILNTICTAAGMVGVAAIVGYAAGHYERRTVTRAYVSGREDGTVEGFEIGYRARSAEAVTHR